EYKNRRTGEKEMISKDKLLSVLNEKLGNL
ncbi:proline--tRNA ligase, partial [Haemophilus influenzae HK1212]